LKKIPAKKRKRGYITSLGTVQKSAPRSKKYCHVKRMTTGKKTKPISQEITTDWAWRGKIPPGKESNKVAVQKMCPYPRKKPYIVRRKEEQPTGSGVSLHKKKKFGPRLCKMGGCEEKKWARWEEGNLLHRGTENTERRKKKQDMLPSRGRDLGFFRETQRCILAPQFHRFHRGGEPARSGMLGCEEPIWRGSGP